MKKLSLILILIFLSGCSFNETREQSPDTVQSNKVNESNKEYELAVNSFTNISLQVCFFILFFYSFLSKFYLSKIR
ncbi:hypothetical protein FOB80_00575 [Aerococcus viridans]|nr:hypothetical protein FOB80_00575 [Aerococcus viridans]